MLWLAIPWCGTAARSAALLRVRDAGQRDDFEGAYHATSILKVGCGGVCGVQTLQFSSKCQRVRGPAIFELGA